MALNPPGFVPDDFREGILTAMLIGEAPDVEDKPAFLVPSLTGPTYSRDGVSVLAADVRLDNNGRPLDPSIKVTRAEPERIVIPIAVEFEKADADELPVGNFRPTKANLTILDKAPSFNGPLGTNGLPLWLASAPFWTRIRRATDIVMGGDKYMIAYRLPVLGMGEVAIHQLRCYAREES